MLTSFGFDVRLFDANTRPLHEASGNNQFRLHLGFHYPRAQRNACSVAGWFCAFHAALSIALPRCCWELLRDCAQRIAA
ncbi:MAG: hypothetical protein IPO35_14620 [Uliginosibacterium sp.]|nr:hypothetical protein [Uliginosibacterium sp.]